MSEQTVPQNAPENTPRAPATNVVRSNVPECLPSVHLPHTAAITSLETLSSTNATPSTNAVANTLLRHGSGTITPFAGSMMEGPTMPSAKALSSPGASASISVATNPAFPQRPTIAPSMINAVPPELTIAQKFKLLGPLLPCCELIHNAETGAHNPCRCQGWRPVPNTTPSTPSTVVADPEDEPCYVCKHPLSQHGDLKSSQEDLDKKIALLFELNRAVKCEKTAPSNEKSTWQQKITVLKNQLMRPVFNKQNESLGEAKGRLEQQRKSDERRHDAPFESPATLPPDEIPTISQIIKSLSVKKYSEQSTHPKKSQLEKLCKTFLSVVNRLDLQEPEVHLQSYPGDTNYASNFQKWAKLNRGIAGSQKLGQQTRKSSDFFGKTMLQSIFPYIIQSLKDFMHPADRDEIIHLFVQDLQQALNTTLTLPPTISNPKLEPQGAEVKIKSEPHNKRKSDSGEGASKKVKAEASLDSVTPLPSALPGTCELDAPTNVERVITEEMKGALHFQVIRNDGKPQSLLHILQLKTIFSKQLPKMPRDYISRLIFDKSHISLCVMKDDTVMGGITYKPFYPHKLAEIAFCAITSSEQVKGYGSHLMNHLKEHVKTERIEHFLTYADNYAIGYFKKQGFSTEITLDPKLWQGYVKDYDGGTLMHCRIINEVNYLEIPKLIAKQREVIMAKLRELSRSHIVYPGLQLFNKMGTLTAVQVPGLRTFLLS
eukprot:TRINITY_DN4696_c0_g1_i2.p1 TRINITY_DN4696_c0_g1~~TRINITY_DN4696_c0_g1_i2.p1  ORF type:complete len:715 (+),score=132.52 TRINITY_DN4696_c0_g1_i2:85-2229(+)